jgi:hypothetical protein
MEISVRGWGRNMGTKTIFEQSLSGMRLSRDPDKGVYFNSPGLFRSVGAVTVAWGHEFHLTGRYRVQADFTRTDVVKLFKAMFGSELSLSLLEDHGFTVSSELQKHFIGKIKLADLTIGDLASLTTTPKKEEETPGEAPATIKSFPRRV